MYNIKFIRENLEFQASPGMNLLEAERKAGAYAGCSLWRTGQMWQMQSKD